MHRALPQRVILMSGAVFLSYASQDAAAAKRLCDALRMAGLEVWFDQNELRGGDAWDRKIRTQIRDCALFLPLISANTQARLEGYFRLEWKLAEDRSHLMAKGKPFLVPIVIDDTSEHDAHVPDAFLAVQWTRLPDGNATAAFCAQVRRLLDGSGLESGRPRPRGSGEGTASPVILSATPKAGRRVPALAWGLAAVTTVGVAGYLFINRTVSPVTGGSHAGEGAPQAVAPATADKSLVVLPLESLSPGPDNVAFADQLHAEIIETLQLIPELRVVSRGTARTATAKAEAHAPAEVAKKLGVEAVLSGNVRREKNIVRIHLELRRGRDDALLWSLPKRDRDAGNQLALQAEIAEQIATVLLARGAQGGINAVARAMTKDPRAYERFLRVREMMDRREDPASIVPLCEEILALDPNFMLAAQYLATLHLSLANGAGDPAERVRHGGEARKWAEAAARMMPGGGGDYALSQYVRHIEGDGAKGLTLAENMVRAFPHSPSSHNGLGHALAFLGRGSEAVERYRHARLIDPGRSTYAWNFLSQLALLRRVDEWEQVAAELTAAGLDAEQDRHRVLFLLRGQIPSANESNLGIIWHWRARRFAEVRAETKAELANPKTGEIARLHSLCRLSDACGRLGQEEEAATAAGEALVVAQRLQSAPEVGPSQKPLWMALALSRNGRGDEAILAAKRAVGAVSPTNQTQLRWQREVTFAELYAYLARPRECVELLAKLLRVPSGITVPMLKVDPTWDNVRQDPAFQALLDDPKNSAPLL